MKINQENSSKAMERLSSGMRINRAGDDAAGLAISEKMRGQIRGLRQATRNAQDGISLLLTAEGALNETHSILQRMRELAVQAATDTNTDEDRLEIQKEINQLTTEIDRIAKSTQFNTMELLDGSYNDAIFHIGANSNQQLGVKIADMGAQALGITGTAGNGGPPPIDPGDNDNGNGTVTTRYTIDGLDGEFTLNSEPKTVSIDGEDYTIPAESGLWDDDGTPVAIKVGGSWYNYDDVSLEESLEPKDGASAIDSQITVTYKQSGTDLTLDTETVDGVGDAEVLKDSSNNVVAVKVDGEWYDPNDVEAKLGFADDAQLIDNMDFEGVYTYKVGVNAAYKHIQTYDGVADTKVLTENEDGTGDVVAVWVKVDDDDPGAWYDPGHVKEEDGIIVVKEGEQALDNVDQDIVYVHIVPGHEDIMAFIFTDTVDSVADVEVLKESETENILAVKVGNFWYAPADVQNDGTGSLASISGTPISLVADPLREYTIDGQATTLDRAEIEGFNAWVLKDGGNNIVAVLDEDNFMAWYPKDDAIKVLGVIQGKDALDDIDVTYELGSDEVTHATEEYEGIADTEVLKDGDDVVAVKVGDEWYAPDDVSVEKGPGFVADTNATPLPNPKEVSNSGSNNPLNEPTATPQVPAAVSNITGDTEAITTVTIDSASEYEGDYTLTVATDNNGDTTATLSGPAGFADIVVNDLGTEENGVYTVTIGDITFSLTKTGVPANDQSISVTFSATAAAANDPGYSVAGINVDSQEAADKAIEKIEEAIVLVSSERSKLGAMQNRLEHTIANLGTSAENLQAAESRIRDLDMAEEMMDLTKNSILQQAAIAMLAQANMAPQSVLQLLG